MPLPWRLYSQQMNEAAVRYGDAGEVAGHEERLTPTVVKSTTTNRHAPVGGSSTGDMLLAVWLEQSRRFSYQALECTVSERGLVVVAALQLEFVYRLVLHNPLPLRVAPDPGALLVADPVRQEGRREAG